MSEPFKRTAKRRRSIKSHPFRKRISRSRPILSAPSTSNSAEVDFGVANIEFMAKIVAARIAHFKEPFGQSYLDEAAKSYLNSALTFVVLRLLGVGKR
jgi:hypothetical protein